MTTPRISVVIPTLDAGESLSEIFDALDTQTGGYSIETVVVDSGSVDGTRERARQRGCKVIELAADSFDHGTARNTGIEAASGETVVLLVQDAVPVGTDWLAALLEPLTQDPNLAGTFARQKPRPNAGRITRRALARWIAGQSQSRTQEISSIEDYRALSPWERFDRCSFDNVCSCIRRQVWQQHPFRRSAIAEDLEWAKDVLLAGYRIAFVPDSEVIHSHERPVGYELRRTYWVHRRLYELFELRTVPSLFHLMKAWPSTLADHMRCIREGEGPSPDSAEVWRALGLGICWPLGQYLGGLAAARNLDLMSSRGV